MYVEKALVQDSSVKFFPFKSCLSLVFWPQTDQALHTTNHYWNGNIDILPNIQGKVYKSWLKEVKTETNNGRQEENWKREEIGEKKDRTWGITPVIGEECTRGHILNSTAVPWLMFTSVKNIQYYSTHLWWNSRDTNMRFRRKHSRFSQESGLWEVLRPTSTQTDECLTATGWIMRICVRSAAKHRSFWCLCRGLSQSVDTWRCWHAKTVLYITAMLMFACCMATAFTD